MDLQLRFESRRSDTRAGPQPRVIYVSSHYRKGSGKYFSKDRA